MSARNKQRGYEHEKGAVDWAVGEGLDARRVFGSGSYKAQLGDEYAGDVVIEGLRCEMKRRKERLWIVKDTLFAQLLKGEQR